MARRRKRPAEEEFVIEGFEPDPVFVWRAEQLTKAGFPPHPAFRLALSSADYRQAVRMLEDGAPVTTILDVLLD